MTEAYDGRQVVGIDLHRRRRPAKSEDKKAHWSFPRSPRMRPRAPGATLSTCTTRVTPG